MPMVRGNFVIFFSILVIGLVLSAWCALFAYSAVPITPVQSFIALWQPDHNVIAHIIVRDIRLPRTLEAMLIGASIAAAGTLMQGLTRNPLASPSVFGINSGAAMGMAIVTTLFSTSSILSITSAAIIGGSLSWFLVMLLGGAWKEGSERGQLILAGIAISALCSALTRACVILSEDQAASIMSWLAGSFAHVDWNTWKVSWLPLVMALLCSVYISPKLNLLTMGDERVKSFGINLMLLRLFVSSIVLILVGVSVSAVGSIAFLGLIVPHLGRYLVGYDHRILLPSVMLLGATLTVIADVLCRAIIFPTETPAGAVLALIGAPFFLYLVRKKR
ncbi:iron chelate uptake ABC transporter family permease subunit [Vibrio gangliei]|uniref:iron chelate uptake ABC transporter family permease subunit n=1 Tax=Vibrio gangliei TaxID=2077090 RepID=UPI000D012D4F|nr:iron chelate uptake ABC transporter family permease subunit [Vibrio gangliei]